MNNIETKIENGNLVISLIGRVDSSNAGDIDAELVEIRKNNPDGNVIVDAENLEYISSAGLRIILRLRKENPEMKLINVSSDVYEIFEMTGFTEMVTIEKAYRKLSVEGCEVLGQGSNGKVYRLDPDTIIKVYLNPDSLPDIHRERELARKAFVMGVPTAIPYDVVKVGEGYGSVFELLSAKSLAKLIIADENNIDECVKRSVDLLKIIHGTELKPGELPDMKETAYGWSEYLEKYLPEAEYKKLRKLISDVPTDCHMMHGDYHIKNVMVQNGESLLIDMDTLCVGHPVFEFASMYNAYIGFSDIVPETVKTFLGINHDQALYFWRKSIELYFDTEDEDFINNIENKAKVVGYTRLLRRSIKREGLESELGKKQYESYRKSLIDAINAVDTLLF